MLVRTLNNNESVFNKPVHESSGTILYQEPIQMNINCLYQSNKVTHNALELFQVRANYHINKHIYSHRMDNPVERDAVTYQRLMRRDITSFRIK